MLSQPFALCTDDDDKGDDDGDDWWYRVVKMVDVMIKTKVIDMVTNALGLTFSQGP